MAAPNFTFQLVATPISTPAGISTGDCVVEDTNGYYLATSATRGTKRSSGVVVGPAPFNGAQIMQSFGDCPASITGLAAGAASWVRVSTAGRLERVANPIAADDVCGYVEADGLCHLFFGVPWSLLVATTATLPLTVGGGTIPSIGDLARIGSSEGAAAPATEISWNATSDYSLLTVDASSGFATVTYGDANLSQTFLKGSQLSLICGTGGAAIQSTAGAVATNVFSVSGFKQVTIAPSSSAGVWGPGGTIINSNLGIGGTSAATDFGGGLQTVCWANTANAPTSNPINSAILLYVLGSKLTIRHPSGNICVIPDFNGTLPTVGGTPGGNTNEVQINNGGTLGGALNVLAGSSFVSIGATPASAGELRLKDTASIRVRNAGNTADLYALQCSSGALYIGCDSTQATRVGSINNHADTGGWHDFKIGGTLYFELYNGFVQVAQPLGGCDSVAAPFRLRSAAITQSTTADTTLSAAQYACPVLSVTGSPGAAFNIIGPNVADTTFCIKNFSNATLTIKKSGGTGVNLPTQTQRWVRHNGTDYEYLTN